MAWSKTSIRCWNYNLNSYKILYIWIAIIPNLMVVFYKTVIYMDFFNNLSKPVKILAPMVGNSSLAYRTLARKYGAQVCYTEMVHCKQFLTSKCNPQKNRWYTTNPTDRPLVIQICGNDPNIMLEAAKKMQPYCDAIDINFGCPQNIACKGNYGAFLQEDLELTKEIVETLSKNLDVPLFCKIRVFEDIEKTIKYAKMIEEAGCSLLAVHGRTKEQKGADTGLASWEHIKKVKEALKIPVIANGNILCKKDLIDIIEYTKCDGIMVAETHLHNPLIFSDEKLDCFEVLNEYLNLCYEITTKYAEIKSHVFKILHNVLKHKPNYTTELSNVKNLKEIQALVNKLQEEVCQENYDREIFTLQARVRQKIINE